MSLLDWTRSQTTSPPATINVAWQTIPTGSNPSETKTQDLQSTDTSTSVSNYQSFPYIDSSGVRQSQDVVVRKEDIRRTTRARVNLEYVSERLKYGRGLPPGDDLERSVTTYEYRVSSDGPKLVKEVTTVYISGVALAGQLQGVLYAWNNPNNPSSYLYYDPPAGEFISHETIIEYDEAKGNDGRDYTRTKTSRWICAANNSEVKGGFVKWMQALKASNSLSAGAVGAAVLSYADLLFEGTEIQINIGRAPVPAKPSDAELAGNEVTNGTNIPLDATPTEVFGNDLGWTNYVPPGTDWQDFNRDSDGDGVPDWAPFVPDTFEDYNVDTNSDGVPDWAAYVPPSVDWQDFNQDTSNDGVPDWAAYVPPGDNWQDFVTDPDDPINTAIDTNNDGKPDWADNLPSGNWQDYVTDPIDPFNTAIDSNGDGIPDWADNTPIGWEEFDSDTTSSNPEPEASNDKSITGQVVFDGQSYNDGSATVTATYQMPFAPDDYFYYEKRIRKLYRSGAQQAAIRFGQTEAALDIGHAYGQNIVTNFDLTPTLDLAPVYIRLAGIEGAFLLDAPSYAWGPEGMVVSSDLMLLGVTGYDGVSAPPTSWLRLPVATAGIGPAGSTTIEASPVKANSINIPGGFNVRSLASVFAALPTNGVDVFKEWRSNTSLVPPSLTLDRETIAAGPSLRAVELEYALNTGTDTEAMASGPTIDFIWVTVVTSPAAAVTVAGLAPGLATGARVLVPTAAVSLAGIAPALATGVTVAVPTGAVTLAGVAPDLVGRQRTQVLVPAAGLSAAGLAPVVAGGASVAVPAAGVTVAGVVPAVDVSAVDPNFSSVSLLLHMDGSNGSTTFVDSGPLSLLIARYGDTVISTAQSKFGGASAYFDGNGDFLRQETNVSAFDLTTGAFTVEVWTYQLTAKLVHVVSWKEADWRIDIGSNQSVRWITPFAERITSSASAAPLNQWNHLAACSDGTTTTLYVNGASVGTTTFKPTFETGSHLNIGRNPVTTARDFNGYIDDLRITKGVARYTANFTPPTAPFPDA